MKYVQSPYFQTRNGLQVSAIVIHTMVGTYNGTINYFKKNDKQVSAHYCVSLDGDVTQMVQLDKASHHAGRISNPTAQIVKNNGNTNPNWYTIGIENADDLKPHDADRTKQMEALVELVTELCKQFSLQPSRDTIIGHKEIYSIKSCPGNIDLDDLVNRVKKQMNIKVVQEKENMTAQEFYTKFVEAFRKHKNDIEWGDDKHKNENALLEDSAMIGRMFDSIALNSKNQNQRITVLDATIKNLKVLVDEQNKQLYTFSKIDKSLPKEIDGHKITGYIVEANIN